jgi:hypothetical protein
MNKKDIYRAPAMIVVEVKIQRQVCQSPDLGMEANREIYGDPIVIDL